MGPLIKLWAHVSTSQPNYCQAARYEKWHENLTDLEYRILV